MSTMLIIGLGHAIFPIIGSMMMKKAGLAIGTVAGGLIAVYLGSPRYLFIDLIGIGVGMTISLYILKENNHE